ncbi:MAG: cell division protein FtsQ/DivIB [Alphaproteobacteria bacterium]
MKKILVLTGAVLLFGWGIASIRFVIQKKTPIKTIILEKQTIHISKTFIDDCLRIRDKILITSLNKVKNCLEKHPFAKEIAVKRKAPHTIILRIIEQKPIGLFEKAGNFYPISENGTIINTPSVLPLIKVSGKNGEKKYPLLFAEIKKYPEIFKRITKVKYIENRRWRIILDNTGILDLSADFQASLKIANQELKKLENPFTDKLDLRDKNRSFLIKN